MTIGDPTTVIPVAQLVSLSKKEKTGNKNGCNSRTKRIYNSNTYDENGFYRVLTSTTRSRVTSRLSIMTSTH